MPDTTIDYGGYVLRISVRRSDLEVTSETKSNPVLDCFTRFNELGAEVKAPTKAPNGEDIGILANLMKKHELPVLLEMMRIFWRGYSDPVFDGYTAAMKLFAAKLPEIKREL